MQSLHDVRCAASTASHYSVKSTYPIFFLNLEPIANFLKQRCHQSCDRPFLLSAGNADERLGGASSTELALPVLLLSTASDVQIYPPRRAVLLWLHADLAVVFLAPAGIGSVVG